MVFIIRIKPVIVDKVAANAPAKTKDITQFGKFAISGVKSDSASGFIFTLTSSIYFLYINSSDNYFFGISSEAIGSIGAIFNIIIAIIVSKITSKRGKNIDESIDFIKV